MNHKGSKWGRWVVTVLALGALAVVFMNMVKDVTPKGSVQKVEGYVPWEEETIEVVESLPIQDGGRIKPLSAYAGFKMLGLHGARSMKVEDDNGEVYKLKPTEWLMDAFFRPDLAVQEPTFRVDNSDVIKAIGVEVKGRRDRYSYLEVEPGIEKLFELAQSYEPIEKNMRDPVQQQTIDLAYNIRNYQVLLGYFTFARNGVVMAGSGQGGKPDDRTDISIIMTAAPQISAEVKRVQDSGKEVDGNLAKLLQQILNGANFAKYGLFVLPPEDAEDGEWKPAGTAIMDVITQVSKDPARDIETIKGMETVARSLSVLNSEEKFRESFQDFKETVVKRAKARGEGDRVEMEVAYFKRDYFLNAMVLYIIGTLCALAMWAIGSGKVGKGFYWATLGFTAIAAGLSTIAIVKRCLIMERPPVGNLYDTVIFIGTTAVIFSLLIEWMSRKRFALGLAPIIGTALIVLARRYELGDAADHLDPLVAVLDSNFWLATHVITISLGYSAGLLAAMLSCIYVLMRGLNLDGGDKDLRKSLTKAVYGSICLTVFLSLVGTVLGGIWANYSWGRFWGWDPKENGALMIVLWTLAILHARLGGIIKDWGLHLSSIFTACIVAFSWWHVNFLGVGLHNYGFTAGKDTIWIFYGVMMLFVFFGVGAMLFEHSAKQMKAARTPKDIKGLEV
ncbi:MAG: cytochrome c biogenesis protein [Luteolibacter sp.]